MGVGIMKRRRMFKKISLVLFLVFVLPHPACADATFNKICSAIKDAADPLRVAEAKEMYKGRPLSGKGYVFKLSKGITGNIAHISTEKNPNSSDSVFVMAFIKKEYDDKYSELEIGGPISFKGIFFNIIYKKVIIKEAEIE